MGQGQQPGDQGQGSDGQSLADRQQALKRELQRQAQGSLPGDGTQAGKDARDALNRAGRAMDQAEQALREGNNAGALDSQAQAMDALRQGLQSMDRAMAQQGQQGQQGSDMAQAQGNQGKRVDPLGREIGQNGAGIGTNRNMLQGDDVYRRARDILNELRKRSGETGRPAYERDYLKRLLNFF